MTEKTSTRGRPRGARNRPKEVSRIPLTRMRELVDGSTVTNQAEKSFLKRWDKISPTEQVRRRLDMEPREKVEQPNSNFILKIIGLGDGNTCPACGWTQDPETYRKILAEKHRAAGSNSAGEDEGKERQGWREAARAQSVAVPAEGPRRKEERIPGHADAPPDPPRRRLLDPDGQPISFAPPDPPFFPFGPDEIP